MALQQLAPDVWHLPLMPRNAVNTYVIGDVLVDAGIKQHGKRILRELAGRPIAAHALTHAHQDHAGATKEVAATLGVPVWVGARDAGALAAGLSETSGALATTLAKVGGRFPARPADRLLREGDELAAGVVVLDVPGHSPGHVAFWREADRTLIAGDVFFNMNILTTAPGLRMPPGLFTVDPAQNRRSAERIAQLDPAIAGFGHGPVVREPGALASCLGRLARG